MTIRSKDMKMMRRKYGLFPSELFLNLRELKISEFHDDDSAHFSSKFLDGLHRLEALEVRNCSFQEVIPYDGEGPPTLLPHLNELDLYMLPELKCICKEDSPLIPMFEKLGFLYVFGCPRLENLVPQCGVSFRFLGQLIVNNCGGLLNILRSSTVESLEQLGWLTIGRCPMIQEIVAADGDHDSQVTETIIFSNLRHLELEELPKLTNFCTANYTFEFPELTTVVVRQCSNMRTFSPGIAITPKLRNVSTEWLTNEGHWKDDLNNTVQHLFSQMESKSLDTTDPSTLSKSESAGKEVEEISDESTEPRDGKKISEDLTEPGNEEAETCENFIKPEKDSDISEKAIEPRNGIEILEMCNEPRKGKELEICDDQGETWNHPRLESNVAASTSRQKDFQRSSMITKDFIPLLNKVTQILQTQPLNIMSAQQVQFMEDAFRDLSSMNFSIEWFRPFIEKARDCVSVAEREREISELELKIAEAKAQLQALEENKKALEEKNMAIASSVNLNKSVYDN